MLWLPLPSSLSPSWTNTPSHLSCAHSSLTESFLIEAHLISAAKWLSSLVQLWRMLLVGLDRRFTSILLPGRFFSRGLSDIRCRIEWLRADSWSWVIFIEVRIVPMLCLVCHYFGTVGIFSIWSIWPGIDFKSYINSKPIIRYDYGKWISICIQPGQGLCLLWVNCQSRKNAVSRKRQAQESKYVFSRKTRHLPVSINWPSQSFCQIRLSD